MEHITSRSFILPTTESEFAKGFHFNLWLKRNWPYYKLETGDTLYWYETPSRVIVWKTLTVKADRIAYSSKDQLRDWLHDGFGDFDEAAPYFAEGDEQGYCLAYKSEPLQRLYLPKPYNSPFPRLGWLSSESNFAKDWLAKTRSS